MKRKHDRNKERERDAKKKELKWQKKQINKNEIHTINSILVD